MLACDGLAVQQVMHQVRKAENIHKPLSPAEWAASQLV
jgi:hypothetical protein